MPIRQKVSDILDIPIRSGRWLTYTEALDREGKFSRKTMLSIIMSLCEEVEQLEIQVEQLKERITIPQIEVSAYASTGRVGEPIVILPKDPSSTPIVDDANPLTCSECGKVFKAPIGLAGHLRSHKNAVPSE